MSATNVLIGAGIVSSIASGLAGLVYIIGRARKAARVLDAIQHIVERELEHNHGSSMKDDMHGVAVSVGKLQRRQDDLERRFDQHLNHKAPRRFL